jgi:hypothetical protein
VYVSKLSSTFINSINPLFLRIKRKYISISRFHKVFADIVISKEGKMPVINITQDQMERFQKIRKSRPQDSKAHETFGFLLFAYEGKSIETIAKIQSHTIPQTPDELYARIKAANREKERIRERELSPIRSKLYQIAEVDKP